MDQEEAWLLMLNELSVEAKLAVLPMLASESRELMLKTEATELRDIKQAIVLILPRLHQLLIEQRLMMLNTAKIDMMAPKLWIDL